MFGVRTALRTTFAPVDSKIAANRTPSFPSRSVARTSGWSSIVEESIEGLNEVTAPGDVVLDEGAPFLSVTGDASGHVPLHGALREVDSQFEELPANSLCSPSRIESGHLANERGVTAQRAPKRLLQARLMTPRRRRADVEGTEGKSSDFPSASSTRGDVRADRDATRRPEQPQGCTRGSATTPKAVHG